VAQPDTPPVKVKALPVDYLFQEMKQAINLISRPAPVFGRKAIKGDIPYMAPVKRGN